MEIDLLEGILYRRPKKENMWKGKIISEELSNFD